MNAMTFYAGAATIFLRYFLHYLVPVYFRFHSRKRQRKEPHRIAFHLGFVDDINVYRVTM